MDTTQLEYVLAIEEEKYVSKAAQKLNISQPALSQFLSKLEKEIGAALFTRSRNGLTPTGAGELYIEGARRMLGIKVETFAKIAELCASEKKRLILGLSPGRTALILSFIMPEFNREFPDIEIQIVESKPENLDELMKNGYVDFSMIPLNTNDADLESETFVVEEIVLAVNKKHKLAYIAREQAEGKTGGVDIGLFAEDKFVLTKKGKRERYIVDAYFTSRGIHPSVFMESLQNSFTCNMVQHGLGVGFIPAAYARGYPEIAAISLSPKLAWHLGISYRKGKRITDAMRLFFNLARTFSELEAAGKLSAPESSTPQEAAPVSVPRA